MSMISGELDIGSLHLAIGNLADEVKELRKRQPFIQDDIVVTQTGICPTPTATFAIDLGHPMAGKWWQIRNITVGGDTILTAAAGIAWVCVMVPNPDAGSANVPTFALRDFTAGALPQVAFYGTHELVATGDEHLYVVITGGTAGQQYVANACVESFPQFVRGRL